MSLLPWRNRIVEKEEWSRFDWGPHGTYNSFWQDVINDDPNLNRVAFCVDLIFAGGKRIRLSNKPVYTMSGTEVVGFQPVLITTPDISHNYTMGGGSASLRSFTITFGSIDFDPWDIILDFGNLAGWAEISLVADSGGYENRFIVMRGDMSGGVDFGNKDESMQVDVVDPKISMDIAITPFLCLEHSLTDDRRGNFYELPSGTSGERFPLILNDCPNSVPLLTLHINQYEDDEEVEATTSTMYNSYMVSYGHDHEADDLWVNKYPAYSASHYYTQSIDELYGAPYTKLLIDDSYVADWPEPEPKWTPRSWNSARIFGTINNISYDYKPKNVVEMIYYLVQEWSLFKDTQINEELFAVALSKIGPAIPRGIINGSSSSDGATALKFIESTLTKEFPMINMTYHGGGYGPIVTDKYSKIVRGLYVVGQGPIFERLTSYQEIAKTSLANRFTLKYNFDCMLGDHKSTIVRDASNNAWCRMSERQVGTIDKGVMELKYVHDDQTASYIADWIVGHMALPSYQVEYAASPSVITYLRLGDNIDIYDPDIKNGTEKIRATVEEIRYSSSSCSISLRLWPVFPEFAAGTTSGALSWSGGGMTGTVGSEGKEQKPDPQGGGKGVKY